MMHLHDAVARGAAYVAVAMGMAFGAAVGPSPALWFFVLLAALLGGLSVVLGFRRAFMDDDAEDRP